MTRVDVIPLMLVYVAGSDLMMSPGLPAGNGEGGV
jgi:hypothetical protein